MGARKGRRWSRLPRVVRRGGVLLVSDEPGAPMRYRCQHLAEQLRRLGLGADVTVRGRVRLPDTVDAYRAFLLHRVPWDEEVEAFLRAAREQGKTVAFDTDDLLVDETAADRLGLLHGLGERVRRSLLDRLARCRHTLRACDLVTASTEALADRLRALHPRVEVAFNVVGGGMVARAASTRLVRALAPPLRGKGTRPVTVAYLSGSRTHERDFLQAAPALLWALDTYPSLRFLAVGDLDLDDRFDGYGSRVRRLRFQPWRRLPWVLARADVNLAPLEPGSPFTACKSCVKYLEAALVGVPTVASPRPDFRRVIDHGRNGLLAESEEEWKEALAQLIESSELRRRLGREALADVRRRHTTRAQLHPLAALLRAKR